MHSTHYKQALDKLSSIDQAHLLRYWEQLSSPEKSALLQQIAALDIATFRLQQAMLSQSRALPIALGDPLLQPDQNGNLEDEQLGKELCAKGQAGCLIMAGGQGTRLGFDGPKGLFPLTPIKRKSLFQLFAEKTLAAGNQVGRKLPLALMTSALNHAATARFFEDQLFFGLDENQLFLFSQSSLPMLNQKAALFLESPGRIAEGPDGNGAALQRFYESGVWQQWHAQGVRFLHLIQIDNPLADPFDAELLGYHQRQGNQITIKCALKQHPQEQVGILTRKGNRIEVVEYSELLESASLTKETSRSARFKYANLSLFCFSMEFIKHLALSHTVLPLHAAFKEVSALNIKSKALKIEKEKAWKFEKFIFDLLPYAERVSALLYPRERCFAPLKNLVGENSVKTAQEALQESDQRVFASLTGIQKPPPPFELAQAFYYPTPSLLSKWKGIQTFHSGYIDP